MTPRKEKDDVEQKKARRKPVAKAIAKTSRAKATKATKTSRSKVSSKSTAKRVTSQKKTPSRAKKAPAKVVKISRKPVVKTPSFNETEGDFYKVFAPNYQLANTLRSPSISGVFALDYPIGERTFAREEMVNAGYGIMIFKNIEDARNWNSSGLLYKVRVGRVFDVPEKRLHRNVHRYYESMAKAVGFGGYECNYFFVSKEGIEVSWREVVANMLSRLDVQNNWPKGTVMTDWVIPVERVVRESL